MTECLTEYLTKCLTVQIGGGGHFFYLNVGANAYRLLFAFPLTALPARASAGPPCCPLGVQNVVQELFNQTISLLHANDL